MGVQLRCSSMLISIPSRQYFKNISLIENGDSFILEMINFFREKGFPIENTEDLIRVKSKVKTLTEQLIGGI